MTVDPLFGDDVLEPDLASCQDMLDGQIAPVIGYRSIGVRTVNDPPDIVVVFVRVERDLLL